MRKIRALAMAFYIVCGLLWSGTEALAAESGTAYAVPEENLPASETTADQIMTAAGLAVFLALAAAAAFFFFRRQKRKTGTLLAGILICGAAAAFLGGSVSALRGKGDLNGDGVVDYADVRLLKQHLTAIGLLSEEGADRADMDGSGALTITDLSLLIRRVENRLDYTVSVSPVLEQFYFEKGEEVSFRFQAEVPYGAWIERVMIDGEVYEVQNGLDSSMYTVMVPAGSAAGIRTYQITKAYLNTGREADCRVSVDVLKTAPEVEAFAVEERTDTAQMQVSFTLRDEDAALFEELDGAVIRDLSIEGIRLGRDTQKGALAGRIRNSQVEQIRVGGITGWLGDGILRNCLTRVEIAASERIGNGEIIGGPQTGSAAVEASLSLSTGVNANRISGWNVLGITSSAYELESSGSESNLSPETEHRVFSATEEETREPSFYTDILGWSEAIWSFDRLAAEGIPSLR